MAPVRSVCRGSGVGAAWPAVAALLLPGAIARLGGRDLAETAESFGYAFSATTTVYGQTPATACGGVDTQKLVQGLGYIAVASAQAMQPLYEDGFGGCGWECRDADGKQVDQCEYTGCGNNSDGYALKGCTCKQVGSCWCGRAAVQDSGSTGTAPMGCFTCARGRFTHQRPYDGEPLLRSSSSAFATEEVKIIVADACPYGPNSKWCPARPGQANGCGRKNHLDFTSVPAGVDNNYFVFTPEPCPAELRWRAGNMSKCKF